MSSGSAPSKKFPSCRWEKFPVTMALRRSLAEKIGQVTAETPTNAAYVNLPDFLTMQGTVGVPKRKLDPGALGQMAMRLGGGLMGGSGKEAIDQVTGALGNLKKSFGGGDSTTNAATNAPSLKGFLDAFQPARPAASTNQAQPTNTAPRQGRFQDLFK